MWGSLGAEEELRLRLPPMQLEGSSSHAKLKQTQWRRRCEWGVLLGGRPPGTFPATATGPSCRLLDKVPSASR